VLLVYQKQKKTKTLTVCCQVNITTDFFQYLLIIVQVWRFTPLWVWWAPIGHLHTVVAWHH